MQARMRDSNATVNVSNVPHSLGLKIGPEVNCENPSNVTNDVKIYCCPACVMSGTKSKTKKTVQYMWIFLGIIVVSGVTIAIIFGALPSVKDDKQPTTSTALTRSTTVLTKSTTTLSSTTTLTTSISSSQSTTSLYSSSTFRTASSTISTSTKTTSTTLSQSTTMISSSTTSSSNSNLSAIMFSGGFSGDTNVWRTSELFVPGQDIHCLLPDLPEIKYGHTADELVLCGGVDDRLNCQMFKDGRWNYSHNLLLERNGHCSWQVDDGIYLIGGGAPEAQRTTEFVKTDGRVEESFVLEHIIKDGCSINNRESVIITGGYPKLTTVSRYNTEGWVEYLPQLKEGRRQHGCASYVDEQQSQVLLVTGGLDVSLEEIDTTEILSSGSQEWIHVGRLPAAVQGIRALTIGNVVYASGGSCCGIGAHENFHNHILTFNSTNQEWETFSSMIFPRRDHAVSIVNYDHVIQYCKYKV